MDASLRWHDGGMMIPFLLLAAAAASPAPVLYAAQTQSIAYRGCIAAEHERRPASPVVEIGRKACARTRSRLVAEVRAQISFGWAATAKTKGQAHRLRAHMKQEAESRVAAFETRLQDWLEPDGSAG
jgi:hypothetical protein